MEEFPKQKRSHTLEDQITRFSNRDQDIFLSDYQKILKDQELMFENINILSQVKNLEKPSTDLGNDVVDLIKNNKESYVKFLREERKTEALYRKQKEQFYNENFKDEVNRLNKLRNKYPMNPEKIPGYLTPGTMGLLFKIKKDNKSYVVKFYDRRENKKEVGDAEITAMLRAENLSNVSHLCGYSFNDGVYVMDYIEGKTLSEISQEEKLTITDEELEKIIGTIINLYKRGVVIDTNVRNFIFNDKNSVNIIDYSIEEGKLNNTLYYLRDLAVQLCERKTISTSKHTASQPVPTFEQIDAIELRIIKVLENKFPNFARLFKEDLGKWKRNTGGEV